ncbi:MAG: 30S ribosomal protein S8 [bacterium]
MFTSSDPIADFLTRLRNAQLARHATAEVPGSKIKLAIAKILEKYGYVKSVSWVDDGPQGKIVVELGYDEKHRPLMKEIKRVSKPSRRVYVGVDEVPQVLNGLGLAVLSTSKGVVSGQDAKAANVGGELLFTVY